MYPDGVGACRGNAGAIGAAFECYVSYVPDLLGLVHFPF